MQNPQGKIMLGVAALMALALLVVPPCGSAAELKPRTIEAFDQYARWAEARFDQEIKNGPFLWVDGQSGARRQQLYAELRRGEIVTTKIERRENGGAVEIPGGAVHHWLGVVFIPGATLAETLRLVQDYDHHSKYYWPSVQRSKLLEHHGDFFRVYLRFHKKKVVTVVEDTEHEAQYQTLSATRAIHRSHITHVREVEHAGQPDESQRPEGNDGGYLWRLNTYWRMEEKEDGTYVQCEAVTLTREVPILLAPIIGPYLRSVPRETLETTLSDTRKWLVKPAAAQIRRDSLAEKWRQMD